MNLRKSALLAVSPLAFAPLVHAQGAVYGMVTAQNLGSLTYNTVGNGTANTVVTRTDGSFSPIGGVGGVYYDFRDLGRVRLGIDVRGSIASSSHGADPTSAGSGGRLYTTMGGVRATFPTKYRLLAPYLQGSLGLARTDGGQTPPPSFNSPLPLQNGRVVIDHGLAYQGFIGLDLKVLPAMDIRIVELGIGAISGVTNSPGSHLLESAGVGVVFHFPN